MDITNEQRDFHIEEYRQLKSEVVKITELLVSVTQWMIVAVARLIAWLISSTIIVGEKRTCLLLEHAVFDWIWYLPIGVVGVFGMIALMAAIRLAHFGSYLAKLEKKLGGIDLGWEHHLSEQTPIVYVMYLIVVLFLLGVTGSLPVLANREFTDLGSVSA